MTPIDYRDATWLQIQDRLQGLRARTYLALTDHGPCTTRQLAERSGIDILTVRPRITELCELDLAEVDPASGSGHEGIYRAIPLHVARTRFAARVAEASDPQMQLL